MNALEIRDLTKSYGDFTLDHLNMTLPGGCILGLVGENGAGKTTTIRLILNAIRRDAGTVTILGKDNSQVEVKQDLGVVMDDAGLPGELNPTQIGKIMALTFRSWRQDVYEQHLTWMELPRKKAFRKFSKGMKMKLSLAIALSHEAKLLILDEPTSGLDPVARDQIVEYIRQFVSDEDHAVVISSHIVSDLEKLCDYVAFLHRGKLLLWEEKDRLLEDYAMWHGSREALAELPKEAVVFRKENPYGAEAVVLREQLPNGTKLSPVGIEELFVAMIKEAKG